MSKSAELTKMWFIMKESAVHDTSKYHQRGNNQHKKIPYARLHGDIHYVP